MFSSLAKEIGQLHELFKAGALTQAEFNDAKQAAISSFKATAASTATVPPAPATSSAPPSEPLACSSPTFTELEPDSKVSCSDTAPDEVEPLASPSPTESLSVTGTAAFRSRTFEEWKELWDTAPVCTQGATSLTTAEPLGALDVRIRALRCLSRLLRNVQMYPMEVKYRTIRESNKIVAQELMSVAEASGAVLHFAGFVREQDKMNASSSGASSPGAAHCWVLSGDATEVGVLRKTEATVDLVDKLLEYFSEQQSRRYGVQQLWRSVALEVRLEQAGRGALSRNPFLDVPSDLEEMNSKEEESEHGKGRRGAPAQSTESDALSSAQMLLSYLVECYTVDEAGDGLYSSMQHLQTLQRLYEAAARCVEGGARPSSTYSLLRTAEVYGAVVQQRGAVELLVYGCGARLDPPPVPPTTLCSDASSDYTVQLIPPDTPDVSEFVGRCLRLLRRLGREVGRVQQQRTRAARQAAEVSMRQEVRRERQRRQLEKNCGRKEMPADEQVPQRHQRRRTQVSKNDTHRRTASSSSSSASAASSVHSHGEATKEEKKRIPLTEALAILMGKKKLPL
ncbi:hypothetical protein JKF63_07037 [Porcisia hertigi]|uniref:PUB domain-containing protein n=1 Tax=Porcisia hertigi TaxID=2761500 RepID=A0A836LFA6_9TRYP|nr:hypothetical protein JKF63_07037 [Porcisia hertigi]